ncbi:protein NO VEIN domain-containing protein [Streptomyces sp. NRRL B-24484]|uniref:protein NO VEIN domain-containing protein n=1 Tax=Streptomyces sp. NRRL B-24484 TaxID=1463833 RepID=UPI0004C15910|nr:DUF3883 domain-containing protein [Streptomyces sp. NRRL B-24484]
MGNQDIERIAIDHVIALERADGREPVDVSTKGYRYDIDSPPRKIEVKAFSGSARGQSIPLEERQLAEAVEDPENFYLYVVDHVGRSEAGMGVRVLHGDALCALLDRAKPSRTYWSTFRVAEYDTAERLQ